MKTIFMAFFVGAWILVPPAASGRAQSIDSTTAAPVQIQSSDRLARSGLLQKLTRQLSQAKDPANARILAGTIRKVWRHSESPTVRLLMERATLLIAESERAPALGILDSVVEIAPEYSEGWFLRSVLLFQMNELGRALHDVGQALDLTPDHFDALRQLGIILNRLGDRKGALNAYRRARKLYPLLPGIDEAIKAISEPGNGRAI